MLYLFISLCYPFMATLLHPYQSFISISESTEATATFLAKADGIVAGLGLSDLVFETVDPKLKVGFKELNA